MIDLPEIVYVRSNSSQYPKSSTGSRSYCFCWEQGAVEYGYSGIPMGISYSLAGKELRYGNMSATKLKREYCPWSTVSSIRDHCRLEFGLDVTQHVHVGVGV
jgi:hypothetical protein